MSLADRVKAAKEADAQTDNQREEIRGEGSDIPLTVEDRRRLGITEGENPRTRGLDQLTAQGIVEAMCAEDATVVAAVRAEGRPLDLAGPRGQLDGLAAVDVDLVGEGHRGNAQPGGHHGRHHTHPGIGGLRAEDDQVEALARELRKILRVRVGGKLRIPGDIRANET